MLHIRNTGCLGLGVENWKGMPWMSSFNQYIRPVSVPMGQVSASNLVAERGIQKA